MEKVTLTFSNGDRLTLKRGDTLHTYGASMHDPGPDATVGPGSSEMLEDHYHDGLLAKIIKVLTLYDYFYINDDFSVVYGSRTVVKMSQS